MPMEENYTYNSLVQFLYREMPADEAVMVAQHIDDDPALRSTKTALEASL